MGRNLKRLKSNNAPRFERERVADLFRDQGDGTFVVEREDDITYNAAVTELYGGSNHSPLFSVFADRALMSWSMVGRYHEVLDWIGWEASLEDHLHQAFITYMAASGAAADTPSAGAVSDPCSPGNTVEFGTCDFTIQGYGRIRRVTPARSDDHDGLVYNKLITPHRINGTPIRNEKEFDMYVATSVVIQDLHRYFITGAFTNAGEFDGLETLVTYGYQDSNDNACSGMDSTVIDWNGLDMAAAVSDPNGTQITINGVAVNAGTYNLVGLLEWAIRNILIRLKHAPMLTNEIGSTDAVILMPTSWIKPFLKTYICYNYCGGNWNSDYMNSQAALKDYKALWNGANDFGDATINLEGVTVTISGWDYELINTDGTADMYLLVRQNSGEKFIEGQYKDNAPTVAANPDDYRTTDNNMLLTWTFKDQTCRKRVVQMQPRLVLRGPWAQIRIIQVPYEGVLSIISDDPLSGHYLTDLEKAGFV